MKMILLSFLLLLTSALAFSRPPSEPSRTPASIINGCGTC